MSLPGDAYQAMAAFSTILNYGVCDGPRLGLRSNEMYNEKELFSWILFYHLSTLSMMIVSKVLYCFSTARTQTLNCCFSANSYFSLLLSYLVDDHSTQCLCFIVFICLPWFWTSFGQPFMSSISDRLLFHLQECLSYKNLRKFLWNFILH